MALTDLSGGGVAVDPVAEQRQLAARLCTSLEQFVSPFLLPCARRTFTMETVAMQGSDDGGGAPLTQMGSVAVQASTAPQLVANVLAKLTSRVYLAANCPGTPEEIRAQFRKYGRVRVSKHDELCMKNEEFCMKTEELCIKNEEFVFKIVYFAGGDRSGPQNMAVSRGHDPPAGQERRGFMNHYPTKKTVHYMFQHVQCVRIPRTSDFYI